MDAQHKVIPGELVVRTSARVPKRGIAVVNGQKIYRPEGAR